MSSYTSYDLELPSAWQGFDSQPFVRWFWIIMNRKYLVWGDVERITAFWQGWTLRFMSLLARKRDLLGRLRFSRISHKLTSENMHEWTSNDSGYVQNCHLKQQQEQQQSLVLPKGQKLKNSTGGSQPILLTPYFWRDDPDDHPAVFSGSSGCPDVSSSGRPFWDDIGALWALFSVTDRPMADLWRRQHGNLEAADDSRHRQSPSQDDV